MDVDVRRCRYIYIHTKIQTEKKTRRCHQLPLGMDLETETTIEGIMETTIIAIPPTTEEDSMMMKIIIIII